MPNGSDLAVSSQIPIVGQPIKILGYTVLVLAQCQCGHPLPMQLMAQLAETGLQRIASICPSCHLSVSIHSVTADPHGHLAFNIETANPPRAD